MKCFLVLLMCVSMAKGIDLTIEECKKHWEEWKSFYDKNYNSDVEQVERFAIWLDNLKVNSKSRVTPKESITVDNVCARGDFGSHIKYT